MFFFKKLFSGLFFGGIFGVKRGPVVFLILNSQIANDRTLKNAKLFQLQFNSVIIFIIFTMNHYIEKDFQNVIYVPAM